MLAKSKLDSIETVISQALTDMEISHGEFIAIFKEKDKDIYNFFSIYKMCLISAEGYINAGVPFLRVQKMKYN